MIIFDLDGTLADCEHRRHFIQKDHPTNIKDVSIIDKDQIFIKRDKCFEILNRIDRPDWKPDWQAFYEACNQDVPIDPAIQILTYTLKKHEVHIWSGRCESVRAKTNSWLLLNTSVHIKPEILINLKMRPIGDSTPDDILKERWLDEALADSKKIEFVFDSNSDSIAMWRRRGIFVFNCCQHDVDF